MLLYVDETHVRSYQVLRATWSEVGRQKQVLTFLDFLRIIKNSYPDKFIVLVLDNARIHHAKMVKDFLQ